MSADPMTGPDRVRQKFSQLEPLKSMPSLTSMNGIGVGLYGKRDFDEETHTYVKTRCICVVFIPLFAIDAYRVADAGSRSWYFFGKEPLSTFARTWNKALGCLIVCLGLAIAWNSHTSSPEYRARQDMKHAGELLKSGEASKAASIYRQHLSDSVAPEARNGLKQAVEASLQSDKPQTIVAALRLLFALPKEVNQPTALVPDAFGKGLSLVQKFRSTDPESALEILNATAALEPKNESVPALRIDLLKQVLTVNPANTNRAVELALAYENAGQLEESCNVLRPFKHGLGATEGARILGQKLMQEGDYAGAYTLLFPYVESRLGRVHAAESAYTNAISSVSKRVLDDLQAGRADQSFYDAYEKASKPQKERMVDDYIESHVQNDPSLLRALASLKTANQIVPVALDLGIVQLNRAQNLEDPSVRKAELEAAEKTFLAIQGAAGESDEYRLFLGQVYYWLGKSKEGKELFDQLLASRQRDFAILLAIGRTLRAVGATGEARTLAEEAYKNAKTDQEKFAAAAFRALVFVDEDDQVAWLEKSDPESSSIQVQLNTARGRKALDNGNKTLAESSFRKVIASYENQTKSAASLNNCALVWFYLYEVTGNLEDHHHGIAMLEEAVALDPGNSILLQNTTHFLLSRAVMEVIRDSIRPEAVRRHADIQLLSHLYLKEPDRARIYQELRENPTMKKGMAYLDKALLLAPKEVGLYETAHTFHSAFRDLNELKKLQQRFQIAAPDLAQVREDTLKGYAGAKDKEYLDSLQKQIRTQEGLAQNPAVAGHLLTSEQVNITLIHLRQGAWAFGGELDARKELRSANSLFEKHPCSATRATLKSAYMLLATEELAQQNSDFAALAKSTRRSLAPGYLLAFVLERGGPLADLAKQNENMIKALALEKESIQDLPLSSNITEWALLKTFDPELAAVVANHVKENETGRLADQLEFQFNPSKSSSVLEQYWTRKLMGDEPGATQLYQVAIRDGVLLPPL